MKLINNKFIKIYNKVYRVDDFSHFRYLRGDDLACLEGYSKSLNKYVRFDWYNCPNGIDLDVSDDLFLKQIFKI